MPQSSEAEFAIIGLPELARTLREMGLTIHDGDINSVVDAIDDGFEARGTFPVIVASGEPSLSLALPTLRAKMAVEPYELIVAGPALGVPGEIAIDLPVTLDQVLEAANYDPAPSGGDRIIAEAPAAPAPAVRRRSIPAPAQTSPAVEQAQPSGGLLDRMRAAPAEPERAIPAAPAEPVPFERPQACVEPEPAFTRPQAPAEPEGPMTVEFTLGDRASVIAALGQIGVFGGAAEQYADRIVNLDRDEIPIKRGGQVYAFLRAVRPVDPEPELELEFDFGDEPEPAPRRSESADLDALLANATSSRPARERIRNAKVVIVTSGKGGVGKTTTSILLAKLASEAKGPDGEAAIERVLLIDGNRGQDDVQKILRFTPKPDGSPAEPPTIVQYTMTGDPISAVITPDQLAKMRPERLDADVLSRVRFHTVLAPPHHLGNRNDTPARSYAELIAWAKQKFDLIIIDTQLMEGQPTDLLEEAWVPLVRDGAWVVGVTELTTLGMQGLKQALGYFNQKAGVRDRLLTVINLAEDRLDPEHAEAFRRAFAEVALPQNFLGSATRDPSLQNDLIVRAELPAHLPSVRPMLTAVLRVVTGLPAFDQGEYDPDNPIAQAGPAGGDTPKAKKGGGWKFWKRG